MRLCSLLLLVGVASASPQPFPVSGGNTWSGSSGLYFKPGRGLVAESAQGDFMLALGSRMQLRYTGQSEPSTHQFQVRRLRLNLRGHGFGRDNTIRLQYGFSPADDGQTRAGVGQASMFDAFVRFRQLRDLNFQAGQFKLPYSRMRIASSGDLMFVDRGIAEHAFTLDRDTGAGVRSDDLFGADLLSYFVGVFTGQGKNGFEAHEATPLFMGRFSLRPFGKFDEYSEPDLERLASPHLAIGAGFAHHRNAKGRLGNRGFDPDAEGRDFNHATADLVVKWSGWSVHGGFFWRGSERAADGSSADGTGIYAATGLVFPRHPLDLAVRYGSVRDDDAESQTQEIAVGANWYIRRHLLKIGVDYVHLWDDAGFDAGIEQVQVQMQFTL